MFDFWQRLKLEHNIKQFVFKKQIIFKHFVLQLFQPFDYQSFIIGLIIAIENIFYLV